jgi:hypothetical protein
MTLPQNEGAFPTIHDRSLKGVVQDETQPQLSATCRLVL